MNADIYHHNTRSKGCLSVVPYKTTLFNLSFTIQLFNYIKVASLSKEIAELHQFKKC